MGGSILDDVSSSALCPPSVLRQWGMNPIDCLGGTRSDHIIMDGRPMFASTAHGSVAAGWQVETRRDVMSCHCRPKMDPAKDRQRCRLDRPARTFVPVPETAWTAASRHFFRTVNDEPRLYFWDTGHNTTKQMPCFSMSIRLHCSICAHCNMHRDFIMDLGDSGLNPCANNARGLAGGVSGSASSSTDGSSDHVLAELGRPRPIIRK